MALVYKRNESGFLTASMIPRDGSKLLVCPSKTFMRSGLFAVVEIVDPLEVMSRDRAKVKEIINGNRIN